MKSYLMIPAVAFALASGPAAWAQTTTFDNQDAAADAVDDLRDQIVDDADRNIRHSSNLGRPLGFDGSVAFRATSSSGNTDSTDVGIGANFGWYDGTNGFDVSLAYTYGEDDGDRTADRLLYGIDYTRDLTSDFYLYGQLQGANDDFGAFTRDTFLGVGAGYRVINRSDLQWSVAGGPGYRWLEDANGVEYDEAAFSLSSNYSQRLGDGIQLSMDTDAIMSEADTVVYNDLGVSVALSNSLALRTSVVTEWHSDPVPGRDDVDNTFGVSLVYNFN